MFPADLDFSQRAEVGKRIGDNLRIVFVDDALAGVVGGEDYCAAEGSSGADEWGDRNVFIVDDGRVNSL